MLFISQAYALLPVSNIRSVDVSRIRFKWRSPRVFYSAIILLLNVCEFGAVLNHVISVGVTFHTSSSLALYIVCLLEHLFFWRLAFNWHSIMRHWHRVEQLFLSVPYRFYGEYNMRRRINIVVGLVMSSALGELELESMSIATAISCYSGALPAAGQLLPPKQSGAHAVQH